MDQSTILVCRISQYSQGNEMDRERELSSKEILVYGVGCKEEE
jgi:hypothetical protein